MYKLVLVVTFYSFCIIVASSQDQEDVSISQQCLGCICHASSLCNTNFKCQGDICGPFQITWPYWADGGKETLNGQNPNDPDAYANCANDPYCAALTLQGYMKKYGQDCNLDGKISCDDYLAIHKLGGDGCTAALPDWYQTRFVQCMNSV